MSKIEPATMEDLPMVGNEGYCTLEEAQILRNAKTLAPLREVGEVVLTRMPHPVTQVCGPMSTGGGTLEENYARIARAITILRERDSITVFSQLPFQHGILRFIASPDYRGPEQIIEELYVFFFERRLIHKLAFRKGWEGSVGSTLEHAHGTRLGLGIGYLPPEF